MASATTVPGTAISPSEKITNDYLSKLHDDEKFIIWLYQPHVHLSIDNILHISQRYNISENLIFRKILIYLVQSNLSNDAIIDNIITNKYLNKYYIPKISELIDDCRTVECIKLSPSIINNVLKHVSKYNNKFIKMSQTHHLSHVGYPDVHVDNGRPHIGWCVCNYSNCKAAFNNADELRKHLEQFQKHIWGLHMFHERVAQLNLLTPEKIKEYNMTKCPSLVCDQKDNTFTPDELCHHFKILGIMPFWLPGMSIDYSTNQKTTKTLSDDAFIKTHKNDECLICLENVPDIMFIPCYHNIICFNCQQTSKIDKCPMCRMKIDIALPY